MKRFLDSAYFRSGKDSERPGGKKGQKGMLLVKTELRTTMDVAGGDGKKQRLDMAAT